MIYKLSKINLYNFISMGFGYFETGNRYPFWAGWIRLCHIGNLSTLLRCIARQCVTTLNTIIIVHSLIYLSLAAL